MTGLKRIIGPGLALSAGAHLGIVAMALLLYVAANSSASKPPDPAKPKLPDAMMIDIVPPDQAPRFEGTPADASTSGNQTSVNSKSAAMQPQPPQPPARPTAQPQPRSNPQRDARRTAAEPQPAPPAATLPPMIRSETGPPETTQPKTAEPDPTQAETAENPAAVPPPAIDADKPDPSQTLAQLALVGGVLGGGIAAPPVGAPNVAHDFATVFLERVSSCSALPPGVGISDKISISVRVTFNPDATLAAPPVPNGRIASRKEAAMLQSATEALQRCQPYTMLPPQKYAQWKTLDLTFSPLNFSGR